MTKEIDELISLYLTGNATEADKASLRAWVNASKTHRDYFLREKNLYEVAHPRFLPQDIDSRKALQKVQSSIQQEHHTNARLLKRKYHLWMAYGAAAVILICVGIWQLMPQRHQYTIPMEGQKQSALALNKDAASQALLILDSGKKIVLDNQPSTLTDDADSTIQINNAKGVMVYQNEAKGNTNKGGMHELYIPQGKEYQVVLDDGTKVWLNSESHLKYPPRFNAKERVVYLEGEAYFDVSQQEKTPFKVITTTSRISVLGTAFNVCDYADEKLSQVTLVRGKVCVGIANTENEVMLTPGEQATVNPLNETIAKQQVNTRLYCGWKDGVLVFEQTPLEDIMKRLSRWYGIHIEWRNPELKAITFSGEMKKYDNLQSILDILKLTKEMNFECQDKTLVISKK